MLLVPAWCNLRVWMLFIEERTGFCVTSEQDTVTQWTGKWNIHGKHSDEDFCFCHRSCSFVKVYLVRTKCTNLNVAKTFTDSLSVSVSRCRDHACSPPIGNLASGRTLRTLSGCCENSSLHHTPCLHPPVIPYLCPKDTHPPAHMTDDPFLHPDTWWASGGGTNMQAEHDEIRLDLETKFCLSYVVLVFRSPRPAAMAIERSVDFGKTWEPLKLFAHNCSTQFGLSDDFSQPGSLCTSRYTSATPCSGGEVREYAWRANVVSYSRSIQIHSVWFSADQYFCCFFSQVILRILDPITDKTLDPYSPYALTRLTLTNLRIRLFKAQTCAASLNPLAEDTGPTDAALTFTSTTENSASAPYAIYTLLARGTCLCHGHAEFCVPYNSSRDTRKQSMRVSGFFCCVSVK